jgi:hypothetical protein
MRGCLGFFFQFSYAPGYKTSHLSTEVLAVVIIESKDAGVLVAGETLNGPHVPIGTVQGLRYGGVAESMRADLESCWRRRKWYQNGGGGKELSDGQVRSALQYLGRSTLSLIKSLECRAVKGHEFTISANVFGSSP